MVRSAITLGICLVVVGTFPGGAVATGVPSTVSGGGDAVASSATGPGSPNRTVADLRTVFERQYGGEGVTSAVDVTRTSDGGFLIAGSTFPPGSNTENAWLLRLNRSGEVEWSRAYGGESNNWANAVIAADDGGFLFAGSTGASNQGGNAWLVKVNGTGAVEWKGIYNRSRADSANTVVQTTDGGFLFGGTTNATDATDDAWMVKVNGTGAVEWERTYHRFGDEWIKKVIQVTDGYVFAGFTRTAWDPGDAWLVKVNDTGRTEWNATYGDSQEQEANAAIPTADGGYLLAGGSNTSVGGIDGWLVKVNDTGGVEWTNTYGREGIDNIHSVVETSDGTYLFTGISTSYGPSPDTWVLRVSSSGVVDVERTYGGRLIDWGNGVVETGDGYLIVGGADWSIGVGNTSAIKVKSVSSSAPPSNDFRRTSPTGNPATPTPTPTVTPTPTPTATPTATPTVPETATTTSSEGPGFGGIVALVALLATVLLALSRRD